MSKGRSSSPNEQYSRKQDNHYNSRQPQCYKVQQTKTLSLAQCEQTPQLQHLLTEISIAAGTSMPDQITTKNGTVYISYPSQEVATSVYQYVQRMKNNKKEKQEQGNKKALNKTIDANKLNLRYYPYKKVDLSLIYDWFCEECQYKNYGRRNRCYKCQVEKSSLCKLSYDHPVSNVQYKEENSSNCSIMIRGSVLIDLSQDTLLDIFQNIANVKDIRMIKNKITMKNKDFAFIQFYDAEDTAAAYKYANQSHFRISGERVTVLYSRNRIEQDCGGRSFQRKKKEKKEVGENYYNRQRKMEIEEMKNKPIVTIEQLKEKKQNQQKKNKAQFKEMNEEQSKRKQAEILAKQWEKQIKIQNVVMYVCTVCVRKFNNLEQMNEHQKYSQRHKYLEEKAINI